MTIAANTIYRMAYIIIYQKIIFTIYPNSLLGQILVPIIGANTATLFSYPIDTIRRHQIITGQSIITVISNIFTKSGITGFYSGILWQTTWQTSISLLRIFLFYMSVEEVNKKNKMYMNE